jgi:hydrogenase nickel incorporation protein HypA/HybF
MHELSIAMSIIDVASEEAERLNARVIAVHLRLGPLSGVVKEALLSAYELAREQTPLADSKLIVQEMPIVAWCSTCNAQRTIPSMQRMCCPACDSPTPDIRGGNELEVSGLEISSEPAGV